eukprot:3532597-Pyramimonas_sp.AAC.1
MLLALERLRRKSAEGALRVDGLALPCRRVARKPAPLAVVESGLLHWKAMCLCGEERAQISMSMAEPCVSWGAISARWRRSGLRKRQCDVHAVIVVIGEPRRPARAKATALLPVRQRRSSRRRCG